MSVEALKSAVTKQPKKDFSAMKPAEKVAHLLESRKDAIAAMLPRHLNAERLLKVAQIAATTTPALLECEIPSLVKAIGDCAQVGLEPNTPLGHAFLVPFGAKNKAGQWVKNVQVIFGYRGLIELARRSGYIVSVAAHEVREMDTFELEYGLEERLRHVPYLKGDRGDVIGYYAVAHLKDGGHAFDFLTNGEVMEIRDASQGYRQAIATAEKYKKNPTHPWIDHEVEMGKKTAVRRLSKYLPLSIELSAALAVDEMADQGRLAHVDTTMEGDFVVVEEDEAIKLDPSEITGPSTTENADPTAKSILAKIEAAQTKAEIGAIASSKEYAAAKAACSPEAWKVVQEAAAKRLEEVEK